MASVSRGAQSRAKNCPPLPGFIYNARKRQKVTNKLGARRFHRARRAGPLLDLLRAPLARRPNGVRHHRAARAQGLFGAHRRILGGLMLDLGVKLAAEQNHDG
jgi:hypothetical protein